MLRAVIHKTDAWQIIKGFARAQNGRQAYLSLISHFKGRVTSAELRQMPGTC